MPLQKKLQGTISTFLTIELSAGQTVAVSKELNSSVQSRTNTLTTKQSSKKLMKSLKVLSLTKLPVIEDGEKDAEDSIRSLLTSPCGSYQEALGEIDNLKSACQPWKGLDPLTPF